MMLHFAWPWMGMLLPLPLLVTWLWRQREHAPEADRETLLHPALAQLRQSFGGRRPPAALGTRLYWAGLGLFWLCATLAMMRPQWLEPYTESRTEGYDLMLAIDASHSMEALDFTVNGRQVTRMAVLKGVMDRFIANREDDRVGLIVFGSRAYTVAPLTYDRTAVRLQLDDIVPNIAGQGTAMGDAIGLGVKKLRERPPGSRVLILVADGDNSAGMIPPVEAARLAGHEGIRIYAIGVGSAQTAVQIVEEGQLITRDDLTLDEEQLRAVAQASGGAYFRATDTRALEEIYRRIDELEKTESETRTIMIPTPLFHWPLGLALVCWLMLGLFPNGRARRLSLRRSAEGPHA